MELMHATHPRSTDLGEQTLAQGPSVDLRACLAARDGDATGTGASDATVAPRHGSPPARRAHIDLCALLGIAWLALAAQGCTAPQPTTAPTLNAPRSAVTLVRSQCVNTTRCVLGFVHAAESGAALPGAVVFLQSDSDSAMLVAKSDEQGVFLVQDPPAGRYRLSVFQRSRRFEVHGVEIGPAGTTLIPIRIAPI